MPALFVFLLKVNLALLVFCAGYYFVLRRLTFYTLNRIYLVSAIVFATMYPRINLSAFVERHPRVVSPVQAVIVNFNVPARTLLKPLQHPDYWRWAELIFWTGVVMLAVRLLIQLLSVYKIYCDSTPGEVSGVDVRLIKGDGGPFSFWKSIFINPAKHQPADLRSILLHEQVHVTQWHSLDIILAELSTIFYWFNPGVWLMKKAIRENIEFLTDRKILQNGVDTRQYQYSLVNVSFAAAPQGIVNHFNISTIKKRIIMMNTKRSSNAKLSWYGFVVPAVVALLLIFSISKAALVKKSIHRFHRSVEQLQFASFTPNKTTNFTRPVAAKTSKKAKMQMADTANKLTAVRISPPDTNKKKTTMSSLSYTTARTDSGTVKWVNVIGHAVKPVMYIVDGKIVKDYDIDKANTDEIATINVARTGDGDNVVLYIQTKKGGNIKPIKTVRVNGKAATMPRVVGFNSGSIVIADTVKEGGKVKTINGRAVIDTSYIASVKYAVAPTLKLSPRKTLKINSEPFVTYSGDNQVVDINHLSDKVIVINGKIATEADLKKLSAFDIDKFVMKTDQLTEELYGDKAKNGVVFIVTKKK